MAWYEDGSPCSYFSHNLQAENLLAAGWLCKAKHFPQGVIGPADRLNLQRVRDTKLPSNSELKWSTSSFGFHVCEFCDEDVQGFNNIFIPDLSVGKAWVFPELMLHYIDAHNYVPPEKLLNAVRVCPAIGSPHYFQLIERCQIFRRGRSGSGVKSR